MGISDRKERQRQKIRQQILNVAEELFVNEGFENVSMRKIASKIEYSTTTIYRHFKNKSEIMEQLIADGYVGVYQRYEQIASEKHDSPLDALAQIIRSYVDFSIGHSKHYRLWFDTSDIHAEGVHLKMTHGNSTYRVYQTWLDHIEACRNESLLHGRSTLELFQVIWTSVHGLILLRIHYPNFPWTPVEDHVVQLLRMISQGLK